MSVIRFDRGRSVGASNGAVRFGGARALGASGGSAPVTDAIVSSINADGWSFTASGTPPTFAPDSSPQYAYVNRAGFDSSGNPTTIADTLILTSRIRQAYPNQASLTADQAALSDYVYQDDTIVGKTNNSTERSPKPVANWVLPDRRVVGNSLRLELVAFHRNARQGKQVACVEFRATDGVTTVTQIVSAASVLGHGGDVNPVIGYACDLDITTLNAGAITANAKVFPHFGVAAVSVLNSSDSSVAREFSPQTYLKTASTPRYGYVRTAGNGGNDGTGQVSTTDATASAFPFATVLACINAHHTAGGMDNAIIYIGHDGGTPFVLTSTAATRTQTTGECIITRESGVARANARVSFGATAFRARFGLAGGWLRFADVGIVRTGTLTIQGEATSALRIWFDRVDFDNAGHNAAIYSNSDGVFTGATFTNMSPSMIGAGSRQHRLFRGITVPALVSGTGGIEGWLVVGSTFTSPGGVFTASSGSIFAYNKVINVNSTGGAHELGLSADISQVALVQNLYEYTSATTQFATRVSGDSATGNNTHIIIHNNTHVGAFQAGRWNAFYDEGATARTTKLHSVVGNIAVAIYTKSDVFRGAVQAGPDASTRTGNWAFMYGVGCRGNFSQFQSATPLGGNEAQQYPGLRANIGTSQTTRNDPLFTTPAGTTVAAGPIYTGGSGGGVYTLQAGSPAIGMNDNGVLAFDLAGVARSATASAAGAYERLT